MVEKNYEEQLEREAATPEVTREKSPAHVGNLSGGEINNGKVGTETDGAAARA
jgi:hypothetical protein